MGRWVKPADVDAVVIQLAILIFSISFFGSWLGGAVAVICPHTLTLAF